MTIVLQDIRHGPILPSLANGKRTPATRINIDIEIITTALTAIMKTDMSTLYPNHKVAERVTDYARRHSTALPAHIVDYHAWVNENHPRAGYMISDFQGQCHVFLARALGARRVLEVGVYVGYSALVWAHAVGPGGTVTGLESSREYVDMSRRAFERHGVENVEVIEGDALET